MMLLIGGIAWSGEPKLVSLADLPQESIRILLGPWANESQVASDHPSGSDLIRINIEESGELAMHLPEYAFDGFNRKFGYSLSILPRISGTSYPCAVM